MTKSTGHDQMVKVGFRLARDEDDYPPADWEFLWARRTSDGLFELENIPVFARGVSYGDTVSAMLVGDQLHYGELVRSAGHSTLRVMVFAEESTQDVRANLQRMGCSTELSHIGGLIAVDVPTRAVLQPVQEYLASGEAKGLWEYEEAAIV